MKKKKKKKKQKDNEIEVCMCDEGKQMKISKCGRWKEQNTQTIKQRRRKEGLRPAIFNTRLKEDDWIFE